MTGLFAYLALVVVVPALLLGHQGEDFPPWRWWQAWHRTGPRNDVTGPLAAEQPSAVPESRPTPQRRSRPSWAHEQPINIEEAA